MPPKKIFRASKIPQSEESFDVNVSSDSINLEDRDEADNAEQTTSGLNQDRILNFVLSGFEVITEVSDEDTETQVNTEGNDSISSSVSAQVEVDDCMKLLEDDLSNQTTVTSLADDWQSDASFHSLVGDDPEERQQDVNLSKIVDNYIHSLLLVLIDSGESGDVMPQSDVTVSSPFKKDSSAISVNLDHVDLETTVDTSADNDKQDMDRNSNFDAKETLLAACLPDIVHAPCSTPMKSSEQVLSFSLKKKLFGWNAANQSEGDVIINSDEDSSSEETSDEECSFEEHSDEDILYSFDTLLTKLDTSDEAMDFEHTADSERVQNFSRSHIFNSLKIHEDSDLSVNQGILKIMNLYLKNRLSKKCLERSINTICAFLPENHNMMTCAHDILNYVDSLAPPVPAAMHFYCKGCSFYHGLDSADQCEICGCGTEFGHFYTYDIASLIKFFFESRDLASIMDLSNQSLDDDSVSSLKDGSFYKSINGNRARYDLSIVFGCDGVRIRKGSIKELWLATFTLAEVPIHLQRSFMTIIGIWYDEKKPNMKTFLKPFVEQMASLDQDCTSGVEWIDPVSQNLNKSRVKLLVTVLDAPARALVQNVMLFNSRYGCNICEVKAQLTPPVPDLRRRRVYYYTHNPQLRTKERMAIQARDVGERQHLKGVRGPSILCLIPSVDVSQIIVPEYLHSVLIGVVKQMLIIWTCKLGNWSLSPRISEVDAFLRTFKHPSFVHRSQRQLKNLKIWKASDFYYFLLLESLPTLQGHLPEPYLQHLMLLVKGIFLLLKTSILQDEISDAEVLFKLFAIEFEKLYGIRELTSNVHQLTHLALCVRRFGPLHCFSAFPFEDMNGLVARTTHGTHQVDVEIVNNIRICQGVHILQNIVNVGLNLGMDLNGAHSQGAFLGKKIELRLSDEEINMLQDNEPKIFSRAKLGYDEYTSKLHKALNSENFYVMWTENGLTKYGSIRYFAETKDSKLVVLDMFNVDHVRVFYHKETLKCIEQFIPVNCSQTFVAVPFCDIVPTIVKVGKIAGFLYKRPNLYHYVM